MRQAIFEFGAGFYDRAVGELGPWREHCGTLAEHLPAGAERVLDLGTGPGVSAFAVAQGAPATHVLGLDLSRRMLAHAARHRARLGARRTSFVRADAVQLPLRDACVDAVTGHSFLYLVPERKLALAEAVRVLRPGGRAIFLEPRVGAALTPGLRTWLREPHFAWIMTQWHLFGRWAGRFSEDGICALLSSAGLRMISCTPRLRGYGWLAIAERP